MKRSVAIALSVMLAGCGQHVEAPKAADEATQRQEAATALVKRSLRDPESARFFGKSTSVDLDAWAGATTRISCGYVNAKNAFGGYTGDTPWYVVSFQDGSSGVCLGDTKDCNYLLTFEIAKAAERCVGSLSHD